MQQKAALKQMETEIARLQVELRQVRQLIGSMIRNEQETMNMFDNMTGTRAQFPIQNFHAQEQHAQQQFQQMRSISDQMNQQLYAFSQGMPGYGGNQMGQDARQMNPMNNDPMQNQY